MQEYRSKSVLAQPIGFWLAAMVTVILAAALAVFFSNYIGSTAMSEKDQAKAFALIESYSKVIEDGPPSKEKTEFIAVTLVVLGDGSISRDELNEIKHLYAQVLRVNNPAEYR